MKKILVVSILSVLLIGGYFVGQFSLDSGGRKSSSNGPFYRSGGAMTNSISGGSHDSKSDAGYEYEYEDELYDPVESGMIAPETTTPFIGNPKGDKLVKTGSVEITIDRISLNEKYDDIVSLIPEGGYVEASSSSKRTSTITVRIPSEKLDETLVALRKVGEITSEDMYSVDRSWDAIDYDARLKIMRERETVLNELLKKATNVSETATIQEQIFQLRTQIESLQGEKDLLDNQVALSTLTITLTEKGVKKEAPQEQTMIGRAWEKSANALLTSVGGIMIFFTAIFPFLILILLVYVIAKQITKRNKKEQDVQEVTVGQE